MQIKLFGVIPLLLILTGCVAPPQTPISLNTDILSNSESRVGVAMDVLPSPNLQLPGADCLLCLAVAAGANSDLSAHSKTLSIKEIAQLKSDAVNSLKTQGREANLIDEPLVIDKLPKTKDLGDGFSKRDFSSFAEQYQLGHMLVVDINAVGMTRPYASYIPTGAPQATVSGNAFLIDLNTNRYEWYLPISLYLGAEGEWNEPKDFPGLTNAYYQVLERLKDMILSPLNLTQPIAEAGEATSQ